MSGGISPFPVPNKKCGCQEESCDGGKQDRRTLSAGPWSLGATLLGEQWGRLGRRSGLHPLPLYDEMAGYDAQEIDSRDSIALLFEVRCRDEAKELVSRLDRVAMSM